MKSVAKLFVRQLLAMTVLLTLGVTVFEILPIGDAGKGVSIIREFSIVLIVSFFMLLGQVLSVREMRKNMKFKGTYDIIQSRKINSTASLENIKTKLRSISGLNIKRIVQEENELKINTSMSGNSWGERITISLIRSGQANTYEVTSKPSSLFTWIDFGNSLKNVNLITNALQPVA